MPLTTAEANALLNASTNTTAYPYTTATKVSLVTALNASPAATAGTEVTGGAGPYARQTATFSSASGGAIANSSAITFAGMPACTVPAVELWDNGGTNRKWYGNLTTSRTLLAGDSLTFQTSALQLTLT